MGYNCEKTNADMALHALADAPQELQKEQSLTELKIWGNACILVMCVLWPEEIL